MQLIEIITEKRRNPEASSRLSIVDELKSIIQQHPNERLFVTFTQISKLGANPSSQYHTPVGIYAYPIKYVISKRGMVPFAFEQKYFQVFSVSPDANLWELSVENPSNDLKERLQRATATALKVHPSHINYDNTTTDRDVWYRMYSYINLFIQSTANRKPGVVAREIIRKVGFDGVVDVKGRGIIHNNERSQAVFFNTNILQLIHTGINRNAYNNYKPDITSLLDKGSKERDIQSYLSGKAHQLASLHRRNRKFESLFIEHADKFEPEEFVSLFVWYAMNSIGGRWPEAETYTATLPDNIKQHRDYIQYTKAFNIK